MLWHRVTGTLLIALAALCAFLGYERMQDFFAFGDSPLRDLALATLWWLLLAGCVIGAAYDFRRARVWSGRGE
jgi:hypothetical protein